MNNHDANQCFIWEIAKCIFYQKCNNFTYCTVVYKQVHASAEKIRFNLLLGAAGRAL
jgi:hypothetical protein